MCHGLSSSLPARADMIVVIIVACAHERDDMLSQLLARGVNFEKATVKDVPECMHHHKSCDR